MVRTSATDCPPPSPSSPALHPAPDCAPPPPSPYSPALHVVLEERVESLLELARIPVVTVPETVDHQPHVQGEQGVGGEEDAGVQAQG